MAANRADRVTDVRSGDGGESLPKAPTITCQEICKISTHDATCDGIVQPQAYYLRSFGILPSLQRLLPEQFLYCSHFLRVVVIHKKKFLMMSSLKGKCVSELM